MEYYQCNLKRNLDIIDTSVYNHDRHGKKILEPIQHVISKINIPAFIKLLKFYSNNVQQSKLGGSTDFNISMK